MSFIDWLISLFSKRNKALTYYKQGMKKAKRHEHQNAIKDYTMSINITEVPSDVKAMALYNRALAHIANEEKEQAIEDLNAVLQLNLPQSVTHSMAKHKLSRLAARNRKKNENTESI